MSDTYLQLIASPEVKELDAQIDLYLGMRMGSEEYDLEPMFDTLRLAADGAMRACQLIKLNGSHHDFELPPELAEVELLTRNEVAMIFGVKPATVSRWVKHGRLRATQTPSRRPRFDRAYIEAKARGEDPGPA